MDLIKTGIRVGKTIRNAGRLKEIATVFAKNGFDEFLLRAPLSKFLPGFVLPQSDKNIQKELEGKGPDDWGQILGSRLRACFEELGPAFVKLGQLLSSRSDIFEASFIVGIGSFFWLPGLIFISVILAGLAIFRQFNWREWVSSIVGFLTPLFFFELYQFFVNNQAWVLVGDIANAFLTASPYNLILTRLNLVFIFYVAFLVLLGSIKVMQNYDSFKIRSRKIFIVFFWTFVCALLGFLFLEGISYEVIFLGAIPVSFLLTYLFSVDRNPTRFQSILFVLFIVLAFMQVVF